MEILEGDAKRRTCGDLKFTYHSCRNLYENRADRSEEDPDMEMLEETMKELE